VVLVLVVGFGSAAGNVGVWGWLNGWGSSGREAGEANTEGSWLCVVFFETENFTV